MRALVITFWSFATLLAACEKDDAGAPVARAVAKPDPVAKAPETASKPPVPAAPATPATLEGHGSDTDLEAKGCAALMNMGDLFAADAADCEKLAADLRRFVAQNHELLTQFAQLDKTQTNEQKAAFDARHKATIEAIEKNMAAAVDHCRDNKAVESALEEIPR
jgi:hypothetical protein